MRKDEKRCEDLTCRGGVLHHAFQLAQREVARQRARARRGRRGRVAPRVSIVVRRQAAARRRGGRGKAAEEGQGQEPSR